MCGATIIVADHRHASSTTCSSCGSVSAAPELSQHVCRCAYCCLEIGGDPIAAVNLERQAASSAATACGEERSGESCAGAPRAARPAGQVHARKTICAGCSNGRASTRPCQLLTITRAITQCSAADGDGGPVRPWTRRRCRRSPWCVAIGPWPATGSGAIRTGATSGVDMDRF